MRRAFTIAELLVTLVIMSVVAGAVAPAVGSLVRDAREPTTETAVMMLLRRARQTALERGAPVTLTLDPAGARWWARVGGDSGMVALTSGALVLDAGVALDAGAPRAQWTFAPTGAASGAALTVRRGDRATVITVDAWTGEAQADAR